jgi:hypothetical protein
MIQQFLDSDLDVVIQSGFIYVPLLFDPSVDREIHMPPRPDTLVRVNGRMFVRAVSVASLLDTYPIIDSASFEQLRKVCLQDYPAVLRSRRMPVDGKLETILFQVMPHFIRGHRGLERKKLTEEEILDFLESKIGIPIKRYEEARQHLDVDSLRAVVLEFEDPGETVRLLEDGLVPARAVAAWIQGAVRRRIVEEEKTRLRQILQRRAEWVERYKRHLAVLLHIAEEGSLEIDGFGFSRIGSTGDYLVFKHTGEYALKDYYGRFYLFSDCRVAVSTILPLKPFVMEHYKHPFLEAYDSGQEICLRGFPAPGVLSGSAMIRALEEGINALLYGYSSRRRTGYHALERMPTRVGSLGFGDSPIVGPTDYPIVRRGHILDVDFEDYRVPKDHPKIASGQVEVTNDLTP